MLLGSHTYREPSVSVAASVVCLSVPRQISETTRDTHGISLPYWEIGVAEQEYDVRFCTGSS